ncbi:MAG: general secretion pathway protein [Sphingobium sp. 66-54]|nr:MAG: general secretion pathway protein [Sphingobium sp. 66-54]
MDAPDDRLTGQPFQPVPDPRFYFESATHRKAMSYLGYGLAQGEGFIVITGESGVGKSMLVDRLMATIDSRRLVAVKLVATRAEGEDMLRLTARAFGLPDDGGMDALRDRIESALREQARAGRRALLIVDEAQALGVTALEELRLLGTVQLGGQPLLQIFLLAQPAFRERLEGSRALEQVRQRVIATCHLEPMQADEIGPYVEHRLAIAGWRDTPRVTPQAYARLAEASGGVPGRVNALMRRLLAQGAEVIDEETIAAAAEGDPAGKVLDLTLIESVAGRAEMAGLRSLQDEVRALGTMLAGAQAARPTPQAQEIAELRARMERVEARLEEQDEVLRRILAKLLEWVERDERNGPFASRVA